MKTSELISDEELKILIRSDMAYEWVESLIMRFDISEETRRYLRFKIGITKEIVEELLPLSRYAEKFYNSPNIFLKFYPGSSTSYDADFVDRDGNLIERIEVTMAIDGYQNRLQSELLVEFGHSSPYQKVKYSGNKNNRALIEGEATTIDSNEIIEIHSKLLNNAYLKKHQNIHKYPNTTLLIGIDVFILLPFEWKELMANHVLQDNTFSKIKCVDLAGKNYWSSQGKI